MLALLLALELLRATIAGVHPGMSRAQVASLHGPVTGSLCPVVGGTVFFEGDRVVRVTGSQVLVGGKLLVATGGPAPAWLSQGRVKTWPAEPCLSPGKSYTFQDGSVSLVVNMVKDGQSWKLGVMELLRVSGVQGRDKLPQG